MRLEMRLAEDFPYLVSERKFPVKLEVYTDAPTEIYWPIDVSLAYLVRLDDPNAEFGFARRITPAKRQVVIFLPEDPVQLEIDILKNVNDFNGFNLGFYRCEIRVEFFEKAGKKMRPVCLQEFMEVELM